MSTSESLNKIPGVIEGTIDVVDSVNYITQSTNLETAKQVVGAISTVGDAVRPFVPLLAAVTTVITEIIQVYEAAQYNKKICNALMDRVEAAQHAVKFLDRRKKENEAKFRDQGYYRSFHRFLDILGKIKNFIEDVSQLQGYRKFSRAMSVQEKFNGLTNEFDMVVRDLNLALAIASEEQVRIDKEALEEDLADMKTYLANIEGGLTTQTQQISTLLEEFTLFKAKVEQTEPSTSNIRATQIAPHEISEPVNRRQSDIRNTICKKLWRSQEVAIKPISLHDKRVELELALLGKLREGKNIVQFHGLSQVDNASVMVFEWTERGNLKEVYQEWNIEWPTKIRIAIDICRGITFLHAVQILHHDIRCENILLTDKMEAKITNFHLSRHAEGMTTDINKRIIEIVHWLAPEKFAKKRYTAQCEIFSYGMLLWELGHNKIPYANWDMQKIQEYVCNGGREKITFGLDLTGIQLEYAKIIKEAWADDPYLRPTLQEIFLKLNKINPPQDKSPGLSPYTVPDHIENLTLNENCTGIDLTPEELPEFNFEISVPIEPLISLEDGVKAHKAGKRETAWKCFEGHAAIGNTAAIYWKGYYLWEGYGGIKDRTQAAELFKKAADDGIADAQLRYAFCMMANEGVAFDRKLFYHYLRSAAESGNATAQYNLGDVYLSGKLGVTKNEVEGEKYMRLAALKNHPKALEIITKRGMNLYN